MIDQFSRTEVIFGKAAMEKLKSSRVAVFGIGGVGGYVAEALVRSGVGAIDLIDNDTVSLSNLNRQIIATYKTIGMPKVTAMAERIYDICPETAVTEHNLFYLPETADEFDFSAFDYVVDAVDTVSAKVDIAVKCTALGVPVISSMGAGNKVNPAAFKVADIYKTKVCPLARVMRAELKKRGIKKLKTVYSEEEPLKPKADCEEIKGGRNAPGSNAFVPSAAGLVIASEVILDLVGWNESDKNE